MEGVVVYL